MAVTPNPTAEGKDPRYIVDEETGCWEWQRAHHERGYGYTDDKETGRGIMAHRLFYKQRYGSAPIEGMVLHHVCENTCCVNPEHLVPMTQEDHGALSAKKWSANRCPWAKLTEQEAQDIRHLADTGWSAVWIAKAYATHQMTVLRIKWGELYKPVVNHG